MARMHDGGIGKLQDFVAQGSEDIVERATPEVGTANATGEESIAREKLGLSERRVFAVAGHIERDAAGGVARSVEHVGQEIAPLKDIAFLENLVDFHKFGGAHAEKSSLNIHAAIKSEIVAVHHNGGTGVMIELGEAADMVDMRVGADNGLDLKLVAAKQAEDSFHFITWVDDDGFQCSRITDDGAVALEHADRDLEIDHLRVGGVRQIVGRTHRVHKEKYIIGLGPHPSEEGRRPDALID